MECVKSWVSCFELKETNDLSAFKRFIIAVSFLVGIEFSHNGF